MTNPWKTLRRIMLALNFPSWYLRMVSMYLVTFQDYNLYGEII